MLVTTGKGLSLQLLSGKSSVEISRIAIGTGSTAAAVGQTALVAQVLIATAACSISGSIATFTAVFESDGASYREVGLFNEDDVMFFRQVIGATSFTSGDAFIVQVAVTIS